MNKEHDNRGLNSEAPGDFSYKSRFVRNGFKFGSFQKSGNMKFGRELVAF